MGIDKLFPEIQDAAEVGDIYNDCEGHRVGVDVSCWLHRFATRHPIDVSFSDYSLLANDVLRQANQLSGNGIDPLFVFDGAYMPGKGGTAEARAQLRLKSRLQADEARTQGLTGWHMGPDDY